MEYLIFSMGTQSLKHVIRDAAIWDLSFFGIARLYRARVCGNNPAVRIVVFHDVPDPVWFESMIRTLKESSTIISPADFFQGKFNREMINVLITFDDGYESWVTTAAPILERYGIRALFFVSSALIEGAGDGEQTAAFMRDQLMIQPRRALTWDGLRALLAQGHTIGGHARTHADLTKLSPITLAKEIESDKQATERELSVTLTDFAYPFGTPAHVNETVVRAVKAAGYQRAYTAVSRFAAPAETFEIPRMCIEDGLTPAGLRRWLGGAYDLFAMIKNLCVR